MRESGTKDGRPVSPRQAQSARAELEQALSLHFQGDRARAVKKLIQALELNPDLAKERLCANLASELTELPADEALASLISQTRRTEVLAAARAVDRGVAAPVARRLTLPTLVLASIALLSLCTWSLTAGLMDPYFRAVRNVTFQTQRSILSGFEYYTIVPDGEPPAGGWPIVVALHGYGGRGSDMLTLADSVNDAGAILLAPTFGEYEPYASGGPIEPLSRMLSEVALHHPVQSRGAILLGHSQGGTFGYRFTLRHPEQVTGLVAAGAPELDPVAPVRLEMPYVFTWGEHDFLKDEVGPSAYALRDAGFNVRVVIVAGAGHELSPYAIEQALLMLGTN